MLLGRHPHLTTLARLTAVVAIAGGALAACGADGGSDVALSPPAETGRDVMRSNGCAACHGRNGEGGPGPTFTGLFGSTVELDDALRRLKDMDPDLHQLVELRFFGGLTHPQIADVTGTSLRTVERQWRLARAWLHGELG